jgi:hypothetical protein
MGEVDSAVIDASYAPRLREEVAFIPVEDEALLYLEDVGLLHQLDQIGAVVCRYFDGSTPIATTAHELADAFGTDAAVIETDVVGFARQLGDLGLLDGVAAKPDDKYADAEMVQSTTDADPA